MGIFGGDMFCIIWDIYIQGGYVLHYMRYIYTRRRICSALYEIYIYIQGGYVLHYMIYIYIPEGGYVLHYMRYIYIPEGGYVLHYMRYIYLKGDFSGQPIFHFIYLINSIGQKWRSTEFASVAFSAWFFFSKLSSSDTQNVYAKSWLKTLLG